MIKGYSYTLNYAVKPPDYREDFFMRNSQTKKLVEISILVALAFVLDYLANLFMGWFWPNGGSISISLVPLAIIAFRYGWVAGFTGGLYTASGSCLNSDTKEIHETLNCEEA